MPTQPFSTSLPVPPYTLDLGEHELTIESNGMVFADKVNGTTTMQEIRLSDEEMYRLHVTLQLFFAR